METKPITQFNKEALINVSDYLHFSDLKKQPIVKHVTFYGFAEVALSIESILTAIQELGRLEDVSLMPTCSQLAELASKLVPYDELHFLDQLLTEENKKLTPTESLNSL